MSRIIKEKSIPFNLEQSKIILQKADAYYEKLSTKLPNGITLVFKPKIFHTLYDMGNTTLIIITCPNVETGSGQESTVEQCLKLFDNALLNAINEFKITKEYDEKNHKSTNSVIDEKTRIKTVHQEKYNFQKNQLIKKIMYELEDFAYIFNVTGLLSIGIGAWELISHLFTLSLSFGTIYEVIVCGVVGYLLVKVSRKIIVYNSTPAVDENTNIGDGDSDLSENTDDIKAYVANELINDHENTSTSEDQDNF